jgi:hypothetical protein
MEDRHTGFGFPAGAGVFCFFHSIYVGSEAHPASLAVVTGACSSGMKRPVHESDHFPPASAEVKNDGAILPLSHKPLWHSAQLIK